MKKLATIMLVAVLAGSFLVGAFVTDTLARNNPGNNDRVTSKCELFPYLACNLDDCCMYEIYFCPYGVVEVWTGEFCPPEAPCWGPFEP